MTNSAVYLVGLIAAIGAAWIIIQIETIKDEQERQDIVIKQILNENALHYEYANKVNLWQQQEIDQAATNFDTLNTNDEVFSQIINKHHPEENLFTKYECPESCDMGCVFEDEEPMCLVPVFEDEI